MKTKLSINYTNMPIKYPLLNNAIYLTSYCMARLVYSACKDGDTLFIFLYDWLQNFLEKPWRNFTSISPGNFVFHHEVNK